MFIMDVPPAIIEPATQAAGDTIVVQGGGGITIYVVDNGDGTTTTYFVYPDGSVHIGGTQQTIYS
jgi:hypothetical protein